MPLGLTHTKKLFQNRDATQFSQACVLISLLGRRDKNHPSVVKVKETFKNARNFELPKASPKGINKIIKSLNSKKATGPDKIPPKLIKLAANIIACHICNILNQSISSSVLPEEVEIANVRPVYKKGKREKIKNYRPGSVLSSFLKIFENIFKSL